jgi:hypothetical protein
MGWYRILKTWMPYQVHYVRYFADDHIHLGIGVTSRAEGSHAVIKKYTSWAKCDLLTVQQRLNLMLEAQFTELKETIEKELTDSQFSEFSPIKC